MKARPILSRFRQFAVVTVVLVAMALLVMGLSGVFGAKIPPTGEPADVARRLPAGATTTVVEAVRVPVVEEAVGTIRAVQEVQIASRILARIRRMHVEAAGQSVRSGDVLVELEDDELQARLLEAQATQRAARETMEQAERDLARTRDLFDKQIASARELERDETRYQNAVAAFESATQAASAAETLLGYAVIEAPIGGIVIDKARQEGDTVAPGEVLMTIYDPSRMQLVASVREQLATRLRVGEQVQVAIDALDLLCHGTVSEIVPFAQSGSRAFDVKVTGPCPEGVFTGMFGRLLVELGTREEIRVPAAAIRSFGQVDQVIAVDEDERLLRRFVVIGERHDGTATVLSGLHAGERIVADVSVLREGHDR